MFNVFIKKGWMVGLLATLLLFSLLPGALSTSPAAAAGGTITIPLDITKTVGSARPELTNNNQTGLWTSSMYMFEPQNVQRGYLHADLTGIPAGATVTSAKLKMYLAETGNDLNDIQNVYRVQGAWNNSITWNVQPSFQITPTDSQTYLYDDHETNWLTWDVTPDVQAFKSGTPNYGWVIKLPAFQESNVGETWNGWATRYSGCTDTANKPYLEVTYSNDELGELVITQAYGTPVSGDPTEYNLTYTIQNTGTGPIGDIYNSILIDEDIYYSDDGMFSFDPGESQTLTAGPFSLSGPSDTVKITTDIYDEWSELNELNNTLTFTYSLPNLVVSGASVIPDGSDYGVDWTVTNIGQAAASASTCSVTVNNVDPREFPCPIPPDSLILPGQSLYYFEGPFGSLGAPAGTVRVTADNNKVIAESDENDNTIAITSALPDLVVTALTATAVPDDPSLYNLSIAIQNQGNANATTSSWLSILIDGSETINPICPSLVAGESTTLEVPADQLGTISGRSDTIEVIADSSNDIAESNENNNTFTITYTLPPTPASVVLSNLNQTYNGNPQPVTVTTNPPGLDISITYNGISLAPINAGIYSITAAITDPAYSGSASGTLVIAKANALITVNPYSLPFDGSSHTARGAALGVKGESLIGLDLNPTSHSAVGHYTDAWYFTDSTGNYNNASGSVEDLISQAAASISLDAASLSQTYTGSVLAVTVTTAPAGLTYRLTYRQGVEDVSPLNAGGYDVSAVITDPTYSGSTSGTLLIAKANAMVTLTGLNQSFDNSTKTVTFTTVPDNLVVSVTYNGSPSAPTSIGHYSVVAAINDANYQGAASGTLAIKPVWDVNGDGVGDILDVVNMGLFWNRNGTPGWISEDVDMDGTVDVADIVLIGLHWTETW